MHKVGVSNGRLPNPPARVTKLLGFLCLSPLAKGLKLAAA